MRWIVMMLVAVAVLAVAQIPPKIGEPPPGPDACPLACQEYAVRLRWYDTHPGSTPTPEDMRSFATEARDHPMPEKEAHDRVKQEEAKRGPRIHGHGKGWKGLGGDQ